MAVPKVVRGTGLRASRPPGLGLGQLALAMRIASGGRLLREPEKYEAALMAVDKEVPGIVR
jgi:hypothetical protein